MIVSIRSDSCMNVKSSSSERLGLNYQWRSGLTTQLFYLTHIPACVQLPDAFNCCLSDMWQLSVHQVGTEKGQHACTHIDTRSTDEKMSKYFQGIYPMCGFCRTPRILWIRSMATLSWKLLRPAGDERRWEKSIMSTRCRPQVGQ